MKRKLFTDDNDNDDTSFSDASPATFSTTRRKRVRYNTLERTLAHMTLGSALAFPSGDVDMWPRISPPRLREQETLDVVLPSAVEEPGTDISEPVDNDMEVEPTVVTTATDTITTKTPPPHGTHDGESIGAGQLDIKEVEIPSAVLDCFWRQNKCSPVPIPLASQTSQALVLYRAPRLLAPPTLKPSEQARDACRTSILVAHEDDVMEIE